jgi:hypothetical protein
MGKAIAKSPLGKAWDNTLGKHGFGGWAGDRLTPSVAWTKDYGRDDLWNRIVRGTAGSLFGAGAVGDYGQSALFGNEMSTLEQSKSIDNWKDAIDLEMDYFNPLGYQTGTAPTDVKDLPSALKAQLESQVLSGLDYDISQWREAKERYPQLEGLTPGTSQYEEAIAESDLGKPILEMYKSGQENIDVERSGLIKKASGEMEDVHKQYETAAVKTGMAGHGGIESAKIGAEEDIASSVETDLSKLTAREDSLRTKYDADIQNLINTFQEQYQDPLENFASSKASTIENIQSIFKTDITGTQDAFKTGLDTVKSNIRDEYAGEPDFTPWAEYSQQYDPWFEKVEEQSPWFTKSYEEITQDLLPEELRDI